MFIPSLPVIRPQHNGLPLPAGCRGKVRNLDEDWRPAVKVGVSFPLCYVFPLHLNFSPAGLMSMTRLARASLSMKGGGKGMEESWVYLASSV